MMGCVCEEVTWWKIHLEKESQRYEMLCNMPTETYSDVVA
jgi:hypothetical protein